jgi:hypothetical protein
MSAAGTPARGSRTCYASWPCGSRQRGEDEPHNYSLPMSQEQLADATGLTPVHVNRMFQSLR